MKNVKPLLITLAIGVVIGFVLRGGSGETATSSTSSDKDGGLPAMYTCSMHPQINQPGPGKCPLCGMDLIPVDRGGRGNEVGPRSISLSPAARAMARVETAPVVKQAASHQVRLSGTVAYDESRIRKITMLSEGQVRTLNANYMGKAFAIGETLAEIYSPDVFAASRELIVAGSSGSLSSAARQKLRLLGVSEAQINRIAESGESTDTFAIVSPVNGVMTSEPVREGQWLMRGENVAEITDPSILWVELDAYEQDIGLIQTGQTARVNVEALPGSTYDGSVTFVSPELDEMKRSIRVRLQVANPNGQLKPGMFARAEIDVRLTDDTILIPASAPLITGRRAVVYVQSPDDASVFTGREIELGQRVGDSYVVLSGLAEGERIAVKGAMRIDSALQIQAKPSMMSPAIKENPGRQTHCPIEHGEIDPKISVVYQGMRIYFCCPGCDGDFLDDPEKYIAEMRAKGVEPERVDDEEQHEHAH